MFHWKRKRDNLKQPFFHTLKLILIVIHHNVLTIFCSSVIFSLSITNGGSLKYIDRDKYRTPPEYRTHQERSKHWNPVTIQGRTVFRKFTFHWDLHKPFQRCVKQYVLHCTKPPVYATDVTNNVSTAQHCICGRKCQPWR